MAADMSDQAETPASHTLRRIWSQAVPDHGPQSLVSSRDKVVLGTGKGHFTDLSGSLVVLDANTGDILRQTHDYWQVYSLALSSDGRWLATSEHPDFSSGQAQPGDVDRIRILDVDTGDERCRHIGELPSVTQALAFSPDGLSVAAVGDQTPLVFDAANGTEHWRIHLDGAFGAVAWSPGSDSVAVGSRNGVAVLDGRFGSQRILAPSPAVAYSQDGNQIVAGCIDGTIRVFAADSGVQSWSRHVSESAVVSVTVSDDGRWVTGISRDKVLAVFDLLSGTPRYPPTQCDLPSDGNRVLFSPTLRHILAMDFGSATSVIDARTGRLARTCPGRSCLIPPDGGAIAAASFFVVERYDLGMAISERDVGAHITAIAMSPTGTPLVAVADSSTAVTVVVADSGARLARKPIPGTIASMVFADGGQALASGGSNGVRLFSIVGDRSWKLDTIGSVNSLAVAGASGEWIATAAGRTVRLLKSVDGQSRWPSPNTHPHTVTRIAFSADGDWIATGCLDRNTRILDALIGTETFRIEGDGRVQALAFTPDGALLATANEDGNVVLIDAAAASEQSRVTRPFGCSRIAFSFDGALLAAAWDDNTVSIFDITTSRSPQEVQRLARTLPISGLAFNPVEYSVAVATAGATVVVYDARDGIELVRIQQPTPVSHFAFSADGGLIATASDDGIVRVWASGLPPSDR
jgi:WD40 repeat protein